MRLAVTADLHFNHPRSRVLAEEVIGRINGEEPDALLVVGDTAVADGDALERCLGLFEVAGPKLLVAGNHELWTHGEDSYRLFKEDLPRRVRAMGWQWLQDEPVRLSEQAAVVGSVGWYDYSMAEAGLGIPDRFYAAKVSPGAAERLSEFKHLFEGADDIPPAAREVVARWNDGKFVKLGRSDEAFLDELMGQMRGQLETLRDVPRVIAAVHHLPFAEVLPPRHTSQWDFARAYLGSARTGELLLRYANVTDVFCGHSHFPAEVRVRHVNVVNIGSGYRQKMYRVVEV